MNKKIKLFNEEYSNKPERLTSKTSSILHWDDIRNSVYLDLWQEMKSNFWVAEEVSMSQDAMQWATILTEQEKTTYKKALGQLAVLDSIATQYDLELSKYITDPAVQACYSFVAAMESIHNHSYTYALSSFTSKEEQIEIFNSPKNDINMLERNTIATNLYDSFIKNSTKENAIKSLIGNLILENLFFTCGFLYFYHLARQGKMIGTQTLIAMIQRDEVQHSYLNSTLVRDFLTENKDLNSEEFSDFVYETLKQAVVKEQNFAINLYQNDTSINLNEILKYIEYRGNLILVQLGLSTIFESVKNPMDWIQVFDTNQINNIKTDFFESRVNNYSLTNNDKQSWDDL